MSLLLRIRQTSSVTAGISLSNWRDQGTINDDLDKIEHMGAGNPIGAYRRFCERYHFNRTKTPNIIANRIRLIRMNPNYRHIALLLVEGIDDARLFKKFKADSCYILIACSKPFLLAALRIIQSNNREQRGILGIVDADYDLLCPTALTSADNVFYTDTHDIETLMFRAGVLTEFLAEYGSSQKIAQFLRAVQKPSIEDFLHGICIQIGFLRLFNQQNCVIPSQALNFKGVDLAQFVDPDVTSLSFPNYLDAILTNSPANHFTPAEITAAIDALMQQPFDPWMVCRGHDLVDILDLCLLRRIGGFNYAKTVRGTETLQSLLRLCFHRDQFAQAQLYASIRDWEAKHPPFLVFS